MSISQQSQRPTFYDVRGVAEMFRMSRMTVYRAIQSGELPAVRIRGRWLVPARVIDALVATAEAALASRHSGPDAPDLDGWPSVFESGADVLGDGKNNRRK